MKPIQTNEEVRKQLDTRLDRTKIFDQKPYIEGDDFGGSADHHPQGMTATMYARFESCRSLKKKFKAASLLNNQAITMERHDLTIRVAAFMGNLSAGADANVYVTNMMYRELIGLFSEALHGESHELVAQLNEIINDEKCYLWTKAEREEETAKRLSRK